MLRELLAIAGSEISPITDARGTATYKRRLLSQLVKAHFITLFPALDMKSVLYA
jgi:xanthine dehydrogenase small subunit